MNSFTKILYSTKIKSDFFVNHVFVILIFIVLTGIFTYPSYFEFENLIGKHGDADNFMNVFWWYYYNTENPDISPGLSWLFIHSYQYYPIGAPINDGVHFNSFVSIPLHYILQNFISVYNVLIYAGFVFSGYGTFLLAKHLTKNYYASIIAGVIFSFGIFHMHQAMGHIPYATTQFIPLAILFLIKSTDSDSKKKQNIILGGIFLFLVAITTPYFTLFMLFFLGSFILYLIIRKATGHSFLYLFIILIIASSLLFPFYYNQYLTTLETNTLGVSLDSFINLSNDLTSFFLPTNRHIIVNHFDFPLKNEVGNPETWAFLGYTALFLTIIAIIKTDLNKKLLWIIAGIVLALISLGPFLKINGIFTGIPLPYYFLHDLDFFNLFRGIGRASIFVILSVSVLSAFGINEIFKIKSIKGSKKILIMSIIAILVSIELLTIPYSTSEPFSIPQIYNEIHNDPNEIAVLETPIGFGFESFNHGKYALDRLYVPYQIVHEKPLYSGMPFRVSEETQRYLDTYFLKPFIWNQSGEDIVVQDLKNVGVSLFNYFDIGYVIVHYEVQGAYKKLKQEHVSNVWIPQTRDMLSQIFSKPPDYEDEKLFAYKVPKSNSTYPFIVLDNGWEPFANNYRTVGENAVIKIINTQNMPLEIILQIEFISITNNKISFFLNNQLENEVQTEKDNSYLVSMPLILQEGENKVSLQAKHTHDKFPVVYTSRDATTLDKNVSLVVYKISLNTDTQNKAFELTELSENTFVQKISIFEQINELNNMIMGRNATPDELNFYSDKIILGGFDFNWLQETLSSKANRNKNN